MVGALFIALSMREWFVATELLTGTLLVVQAALRPAA
jgi:hypothetical protein